MRSQRAKKAETAAWLAVPSGVSFAKTRTPPRVWHVKEGGAGSREPSAGDWWVSEDSSESTCPTGIFEQGVRVRYLRLRRPTKGIYACPSGTTLFTVSHKTW